MSVMLFNPLQSVSIQEAQYAVIGVGSNGGVGILSWHETEFVARRANAENIRKGGKSRVAKTPNAQLNATDNVIVNSLLGEF